VAEISWDAVEALDVKLKALGFGDTWAGRFVGDTVSSRQMPRGRGITILEEFLARDWLPLALLASAAEELIPKSTVDGVWLKKFAETVRNGYPVPDWKMKQFEEIKAKLTASAARPLTVEEQRLVADLKKLAAGRHYRWWSERPGQDKRFKELIHAVEAGQPIFESDLTWMKSLFKGALTQLHDDKHPIGALRYVDGEMCYIVSAPYVHPEWLHVVVDIVQAGHNQMRPVHYIKIKIRGPSKKEQ
jgi:hypothetical protein